MNPCFERVQPGYATNALPDIVLQTLCGYNDYDLSVIPPQASMPSAIEAARRELQALEGSGVICVTGSLHAVAEALSSVDLRLQS